MVAHDLREIARRLREDGVEVFAGRAEIALAYVYGSVARGQALPDSDVDVGVVLGEERDGLGRLDLELGLERELAAATGVDDVDVRVLNDAPLLVQGEAVTEGVLVYARDGAFRVGYETWARSRYFDYLPAARAMAEAFEEALRRRLSGGGGSGGMGGGMGGGAPAGAAGRGAG